MVKFPILLVLIVASGFASYFIIKRLQKTKTRRRIFASPIENRDCVFQNLDKTINKGDVKEYYSEMTISQERTLKNQFIFQQWKILRVDGSVEKAIAGKNVCQS